MTKTKTSSAGATLTIDEARSVVEELEEIERERSKLVAGYTTGNPEAVAAMNELDERAARLRATGAEAQVLGAEADAIEQAKPGWMALAPSDSSAAWNLARADERVRELRREAERISTPAKQEAYKQEGLDDTNRRAEQRRLHDRQERLRRRIINARRAEMVRRGAGGPNVAGQQAGTAQVVEIARAVEQAIAHEFDRRVEEVFGEGTKAAHIRDVRAEQQEFGTKLGPGEAGEVVSAAGEVEPTQLPWKIDPESGEVVPDPEAVNTEGEEADGVA